MKGFDDWMDENYSDTFDMPHQREAYEAGAASRQGEVDELQRRIDEALSAVWDDKCSHTVIDILKGDQND